MTYCGCGLSNTRQVGFDGLMRLISVTLPDGNEPTWKDTVPLNIGIDVLLDFNVRITHDQEESPVIHMTVSFAIEKGRYVATFVGLESQHEITGTEIREIRVAEALRLASLAGIFIPVDKDAPPSSIRDWWGEDDLTYVGNPLGEKAKKDGPVDWVLPHVALVYNIAQISSQPPAKAVEKAFGLPARTAARWIAKAREKDVLKRPSVSGWEDVVDSSDKIREVAILGRRYVRKVDHDEFMTTLRAKLGERNEAP